jgi:hypothetical protein
MTTSMTTDSTTVPSDVPPASAETLFDRLAEVWVELEERLADVPVLSRLADGTVTIHDYERLLFNLRQQVVDGSPWISRAASNFDIAHFTLRAAAIRHAEEEHRDYLMLERDYVAIGGSLDELRSGRKNLGSEALSGYMFHYADRPNPVGLLGAMFIIEGLGATRGAGWAARFQEVLDEIVRCAQVVARLYALQLEELDR